MQRLKLSDNQLTWSLLLSELSAPVDILRPQENERFLSGVYISIKGISMTVVVDESGGYDGHTIDDQW